MLEGLPKRGPHTLEEFLLSALLAIDPGYLLHSSDPPVAIRLRDCRVAFRHISHLRQQWYHCLFVSSLHRWRLTTRLTDGRVCRRIRMWAFGGAAHPWRKRSRLYP